MSSENKAKISDGELDYEGKITAHIIDEKAGAKEYTDIYGIRIHSKDYVLLVMNDYTPIIGRIDGDVTLLSKNGEKEYKGIHAFYKHLHNVFTLIIDNDYKEAEKA